MLARARVPLFVLGFLVVIAGCASLGGYDSTGGPGYAPDPSTFYSALDPYGSWVYLSPYGSCWAPNDLVHRHAKLGGILLELSGDALGPSVAIIGVGLNVRLPASLRREVAQPVTDLAAIAARRTIDRNALLARVAVELVRMLLVYATKGFVPFRTAWQRRHALQKKSVRIVLPDGVAVRGEVVGVDADGALILDSAGRRSRYVSGEVSLRHP